jgi:hypothetical protein
MSNRNNTYLRKANKSKNDEFYTQLSDVEKEVKHYKEQFKDKVVLCNCDDPRVSSFFHHFSYSYEQLGLKKLITTCYKNQNRDLFSENNSERAIYLEYTGDKDGNNVPDSEEIGIKQFNGDGDFRSDECIELLKQADIVVTNPPFSLFREYVMQLVKYEKKFLLVGTWNAVGYKEIFKLIKDDKVWLGVNSNRNFSGFIVPKHYPLHGTEARVDENGNRIISSNNTCWFTNLDLEKRHEDLILYKTYQGNESDYPKYENYDAINVDKTKDIPVDYAGHIGVPITFMDKYNPDQFEIVGLGIANLGLEMGVEPYKQEHKKYRKEIQKRGAVDGDLYMMIDGEVTVPYSRIIIRNKRL